jgi:diguanylate cyclase (GGDEF)-like protein
MAARYGGEEFALVLPDTSLSGAVQIAEKARTAIAQLHIEHDYSSAALHISISGGVAVMEFTMDKQQFIATADERLYLAKQQGRNRMSNGSSLAVA